MGCGGSVHAHSPGGNQPPMVIIRDGSNEGTASDGDRINVPAVLDRLWSETETMTEQQRKHDSVLLMNFLRERRAEQQDNHEQFSYTLGSLLGLYTLREAADLDDVPEILKPLEPSSIRGVGELATIHAELKMRVESYLATIATVQADAKSHAGLKRRRTGLSNARLFVARVAAAGSAKEVGSLRIQAENELWKAIKGLERVRDAAPARAAAARRHTVASAALEFLKEYDGRDEGGALMVDDELRRKYRDEASAAVEELETATRAAVGVKEARSRLATAREKLRVVEKFKDTRPTAHEAAAVTREIDAEICETTRLLESTRIPRATHRITKDELHRAVGELSVLIHARAVRQATFGPGVQKIMLEVNVDQCPATAVTATVLYSHARAAIKRELLEATATVASLQGCKHAYRLAKRQLLAAEGALEFITFLQRQQAHEIRGVIMMVDGGMKADMLDTNVALGPEGVEEHRQLKEKVAKADIAKGALDFFAKGTVLGGLDGFGSTIRQTARAKANKTEKEANIARATLAVRKQSKSKARRIEGKMLVMAAVRGSAQRVFDRQQEQKRHWQQQVMQTHPPMPKHLREGQGQEETEAPLQLTSANPEPERAPEPEQEPEADAEGRPESAGKAEPEPEAEAAAGESDPGEDAPAESEQASSEPDAAGSSEPPALVFERYESQEPVMTDEDMRERVAEAWCGTPQHGLSTNKMALITSDCGTMCYPTIKWP